MRDPYDVSWRNPRRRARRNQIRLSEARQEIPPRPKQGAESERALRRSGLGLRDFLATTRSAKPSTAAKSTRKASRARRNSSGFGYGGQPGSGPRDFRNFGFDFGAGGFSTEGGSIDPDILSELFGAGRSRARSQAAGEGYRRHSRGSLATIAYGGSTRVVLPTGKTPGRRSPAGIEEGKSIRLRGQGQPGAGGQSGDVIVTIRYAAHPLSKWRGAI